MLQSIPGAKSLVPRVVAIFQRESKLNRPLKKPITRAAKTLNISRFVTNRLLKTDGSQSSSLS